MYENLLLRVMVASLSEPKARGAPGKSGLHASGEGERLIALEPW